MFFKKCASVLSLPLCHIFDTSFKDCSLPDIWKSASVVPVFKKGSTLDPNDYRPISLTSTCCRVMERIINKEIHTHLLQYNLISRHQHGFVSKRSTCTNLLECLHDWSYNIQNKHGTDVIDFKKAFDSVSHSKLMTKILAYSLVGNLYNWLASFFGDRTQAVKIDNITSSYTSIITGVPQAKCT